MLLTPTYHVFEMYKVHQDATLLPVDLRCDDYTHGELTMPGLSATASRDTAGVVHLSLCNVNPHQDAELICELRGMELSTVRGRVLTAAAMTAHNTFDEPTQVSPTEFHGAALAGNRLKLTVPAKAVVSLELEERRADV
jgi:alpha-N-arabinofuranosidase